LRPRPVRLEQSPGSPEGPAGKQDPALEYGDLAGLLKLWKRSEEYGFLKEAHAQAEQQVLRDLDRAIWNGLKRTKAMPRFRKKGRQDSFRYPQGFKIEGSRVYLPKIGWVSFFKSREIQGTLKNVTVSRKGRHWFVSIQTERVIGDPMHPSTSTVGIDLGVRRFATLSDGTSTSLWTASGTWKARWAESKGSSPGR